jgi:hypothetical protein
MSWYPLRECPLLPALSNYASFHFSGLTGGTKISSVLGGKLSTYTELFVEVPRQEADGLRQVRLAASSLANLLVGMFSEWLLLYTCEKIIASLLNRKSPCRASEVVRFRIQHINFIDTDGLCGGGAPPDETAAAQPFKAGAPNHHRGAPLFVGVESARSEVLAEALHNDYAQDLKHILARKVDHFRVETVLKTDGNVVAYGFVPRVDLHLDDGVHLAHRIDEVNSVFGGQHPDPLGVDLQNECLVVSVLLALHQCREDLGVGLLDLEIIQKLGDLFVEQSDCVVGGVPTLEQNVYIERVFVNVEHPSDTKTKDLLDLWADTTCVQTRGIVAQDRTTGIVRGQLTAQL